jgi:UDP-N-acetylmuramate dehydrogenase
LKTILQENKAQQKFILGGGSNMLLTKDIDALVIHIDLKGKRIIEENEDFVWVESQAGESWHEFVLWTIDQNFGGLENMSLIPGNVELRQSKHWCLRNRNKDTLFPARQWQ